MLEPGGEPDLAQEPLGAERGGELGVQHLERDRPVVPEVLREVDRGHAAAAELALERVAVAAAPASELRATEVGASRACPPPACWNRGLLRSGSNVGIDPEPAGREVVRHLEQRLELVERLLRLARPGCRCGRAGAGCRARCRRPCAIGSSATPRSPSRDRLGLAAQVGEREPAEDVALGVVRRRRGSAPRRPAGPSRRRPGPGPVAPKRSRSAPARCPRWPRSSSNAAGVSRSSSSLLLVVEHPEEIAEVAEVRDDGGRVDVRSATSLITRRARRQVALRQIDHRLVLEQRRGCPGASAMAAVAAASASG